MYEPQNLVAVRKSERASPVFST